MSQTLLISEDHLKETRNVWFRLGLICGTALSVVILGLVAVANVESGDGETDVLMRNHHVYAGEVFLIKEWEVALNVCRVFQERYNNASEGDTGAMITQCLELEQ